MGRRTLGERSVQYIGPVIWNSLVTIVTSSLWQAFVFTLLFSQNWKPVSCPLRTDLSFYQSITSNACICCGCLGVCMHRVWQNLPPSFVSIRMNFNKIPQINYSAYKRFNVALVLRCTPNNCSANKHFNVALVLRCTPNNCSAYKPFNVALVLRCTPNNCSAYKCFNVALVLRCTPNNYSAYFNQL